MSRPIPQFHGFIGQAKEVAQLRNQIEGGKASSQPLKLVLLAGPSGIGKTSLAQAAAAHVGSSFIGASAYEGPESLAQALLEAEAGSVLFLDEAHNLSGNAQELLYQVVDQRSVPRWAVGGGAAEGGKPAGADLPIRPVSIILATDQPGSLRPALLKRVELRLHLRLYTRSEMRAIIAALEPQAQITLTPQARSLLARVCGGLPRQARYLLGRLARHYGACEGSVDMPGVRRFLKDSGIDRLGLGPLAQRYLRYLGRMGQASLESLALHLGCDPAYLRRDIEGQLMRQELIVIGTGGRRLSRRGEARLAARRRHRKASAAMLPG